jgi:hypothetical protein
VSNEREWVETLKAALLPQNMIVETGFRLPYALHALHISSYHNESVEPARIERHEYQTDLLAKPPLFGKAIRINRLLLFGLGSPA